MKFRKKPVVIEAFQMTEARRASNADWPQWLHVAWQGEHIFPEKFPHSDGTDKLVIRTLEGMMMVEWGDWIIQGVNGELYPCKPDIFAKTYEDATVLDDRARLRGALVALVGTENPNELRQIEAVTRAQHAPDIDKVAIINAVTVLLETQPV